MPRADGHAVGQFAARILDDLVETSGRVRGREGRRYGLEAVRVQPCAEPDGVGDGQPVGGAAHGRPSADSVPVDNGRAALAAASGEFLARRLLQGGKAFLVGVGDGHERGRLRGVQSVEVRHGRPSCPMRGQGRG